ncbi:MAG: efflux RND transporter periplasmic adaptor subunit [Burkholderiaceae bacterium]
MTLRLATAAASAVSARAIAALALALALPALQPARGATALATAVVERERQPGQQAYDGVVQAVRQTTIAAQVPGAVVAVDAKAGDTVRAGQVLLQLDARAAQQAAAAGSAQARAARAAQEAAAKEFERQKQLFQKHYISQASLDRAEAQYKATQAEAAAQLASAGAAQTTAGFYVVRAPYSGVVAEVAVVLGDMAMPGRPLVTLYDPAALRVSAALPETAALQSGGAARAQVELGVAASARRLTPTRTQWLPAVDPSTHTQELRLDLPAGLQGVRPGAFARVWLAAEAAPDRTPLLVPARAVVRRAELAALYVVDGRGVPVLRQVRLGPAQGDRVEVLSGVSAGEAVALDPQAAAAVAAADR